MTPTQLAALQRAGIANGLYDANYGSRYGQCYDGHCLPDSIIRKLLIVAMMEAMPKWWLVYHDASEGWYYQDRPNEDHFRFGGPFPDLFDALFQALVAGGRVKA